MGTAKWLRVLAVFGVSCGVLLWTGCQAVPQNPGAASATPSISTTVTQGSPATQEPPTFQEEILSPLDADGRLKPEIHFTKPEMGLDWAACSSVSVPFTKGRPVAACHTPIQGPNTPCWRLDPNDPNVPNDPNNNTAPKQPGETKVVCLTVLPEIAWQILSADDFQTPKPAANQPQPLIVETTVTKCRNVYDGKPPAVKDGQFVMLCQDGRAIVQLNNHQLIEGNTVQLGVLNADKIIETTAETVTKVWYVG